ncbi:MAG: hypothetical protein E6I75_28375 [Chloroflexi bacterium]|nr:MAG: hypothetical protein E6I75_28375 [Chloroflexota bacterium]
MAVFNLYCSLAIRPSSLSLNGRTDYPIRPKRRFGLDRCRYHGEAGMERWVGFGLLAHNLRQISHSLASR